MIDKTHSPAAGTRMNADDFLDLPETTTPMQLLNGEIIVSPTPIPNHQKIVGRLYKMIDRLISDGEVILSPMDIYLDDETVVQPDVFWVAEDSACVEEPTHYRGAPDLVVEVLSPSTAQYDRQHKFKLYEQYGVREYWIIDPPGKVMEIWCLEDERFIKQGTFKSKDTFSSTLLDGQTIAVSETFK